MFPTRPPESEATLPTTLEHEIRAMVTELRDTKYKLQRIQTYLVKFQLPSLHEFMVYGIWLLIFVMPQRGRGVKLAAANCRKNHKYYIGH